MPPENDIVLDGHGEIPSEPIQLILVGHPHSSHLLRAQDSQGNIIALDPLQEILILFRRFQLTQIYSDDLA